jgi:predicted RNA-binding protein YlqC (UPF0109 family)
MQEFVTYLIKNLVDNPDGVDVKIFNGSQSTIVEVKVSDIDVAKIVGKQGRTIKALRTISMIVGARFGRKVKLELLQQQG